MTELRFVQVDAFADRPFTGNPAAVMPLDAWLADEMLQAIAMENNPQRDRLHHPGTRRATPITSCAGSRRPSRSLLCGHATLASGHVLIGDRDRIRFRTRTRGHARSGQGRRRLCHVAAGLEGRAEAAAARSLAALGCAARETLWHPSRYALIVLDSEAEVLALEARFPRARERRRHPGHRHRARRRRPTWSAASSPRRRRRRGSGHRLGPLRQRALLGRAARPRPPHRLPGEQRAAAI